VTGDMILSRPQTEIQIFRRWKMHVAESILMELTVSSCWVNEIIVCSYRSSRVAAYVQQIVDIAC